jgi:hypothetical protein
MWESIAVVMALLGAWLSFKLAATYFVAPEKTGRQLLVREVRKRGGDVSAIPDAAWDELVSRCIRIAKVTANAEERSSDWRAILSSSLEIQASFVASVLNGCGGHEPTRETLLKHGVNVPPLRD